ncbi:hypothetical protein PPL_00686 [Heterostelium album PN500]|uniref:HAT C-terminal dimerisation domain-containing protein n=1 Tax=Heterostelium pallidum (strain ATCC 26659 / Pp 5 / PN500) TaxID=670386 RepID=D3AX57_HETP5|nr:hypothetical protein PPL_00686 [Heterostelium album PN500]EFA86126.1 hypothetical protein PPL_00686 [Heterostelium album PN500]|eukprot:XP_020438231.1 hypothetical protein PPL_00686 [Heterostelium album PN500]
MDNLLLLSKLNSIKDKDKSHLKIIWDNTVTVAPDVQNPETKRRAGRPTKTPSISTVPIKATDDNKIELTLTDKQLNIFINDIKSKVTVNETLPNTTPTTTTSPAKVTPQIDLSPVSFNPFYRYSKDPQPIELNVDILKKQLMDFHNYQYVTEEEERLGKYSNPAIFWSQNNHLFPYVAQLARKYMCVPASSVPSESVFSKANYIFSERRQSMLSSTLRDCVLLYCNKSLFTNANNNNNNK